MSRRKFVLSFEFVWLMFWASVFLMLLSGLGKAFVWETSDIFLILAPVFFFPVWVILLHEIAVMRSNNRIFWLVVMLITPPLAALAYLLQRERLIRLPFLK
ncbi:MAG: hypothetical protein EA411_02875 [Saprospirales bacterium]|nr:MAG: hypothetical protein EA411_02875 [Saprospirales bacterium]